MVGSQSSDGQRYKTDQNPKIGKYYKFIGDLQKVELFTLVSHLETGEKPKANTYKLKNDLLFKLIDLVPAFITEHETKKIFLDCKVKDGHHFVKARLTVSDETEYDDYRAGRAPTNMTELIVEYNKSKEEKAEDENLEDFVACADFFKTEEAEEVSPSKHAALFEMCSNLSVALKQNTEQNNNLAVALRGQNGNSNETQLQKLTKISLKNLKFDEDEGVSIFLNNIETVALGHNLTLDTDKIQLAISILSQTSKGSKLLKLSKLDTKTFDDWAAFKQELFLMENSSQASFRIKFRSYKRGAEEPPAVLMAELVDLYQRSEGYSDDHDLTDRDIREIREKFLSCLDKNTAKQCQQAHFQAEKFKRDEDPSSLKSLAELCMKLEEIDTRDYPLTQKAITFNHGTHPTVMNVFEPKKDPLCAESQNDMSELKQLMTQQNQLLMNITTTMANNSSNYRSRSGYNSKRYPSLDFKKLNGYCLNQILNKCKKGDSCRYKHGIIPTEVLDYVKSLDK